MKIGIITGASSGMGKWFAAYAKLFYPDIEELWLIGRNTERLTKLSFKLEVKSKVLSLDLTNDNDLLLLENWLRNDRPEIKLLVNSAGMGIIGRFEALNTYDIEDMLSINCLALSKTIRICLDYMSKGSHIINLASAAAFIPQPEFAVYAASKSYVLSLSDALYKELKKDGISVTAVCPGCVKTPFFEQAQKYSSIKPYKKLFMARDNKVVYKAMWDAKRGKIHSIYGLSMKALYIACKILPEKWIMFFI